MDIKMLEYNKVAKIITEYVQEMTSAEEYIDNLPSDAYSFVLDNQYTSTVETLLLQTLEVVLGSDLNDDLMWFMSDAEGNTLDVVRPNGSRISYTIDSLETFLEYIRAEYY